MKESNESPDEIVGKFLKDINKVSKTNSEFIFLLRQALVLGMTSSIGSTLSKDSIDPKSKKGVELIDQYLKLFELEEVPLTVKIGIYQMYYKFMEKKKGNL